MKRSHITASFLLTAVMLFGGCSENQNNSAPAADTSSISTQPESSAESSIVEAIQSTTEISSTESSTQSAPESVPEPVPVEFTDEDRELQDILTEMYDPIFAIYKWFCRIMVPNATYPDAHGWELIIPEISYEGEYIKVPDNFYLISKSFYVPTTKAGMEELIPKYFSKEMTESLMKRFTVCESIEKSDKTITLKLKYPESYERVCNSLQFIEVDGHLYALDMYGVGRFIDVETSKVTNRTDDTIEFSFLDPHFFYPDERKQILTDVSLYSSYADIGVIKLEDGVWKMHLWDDFHFPLEPMSY